jgi:5-methylthioadenosine/S-adenosylhomocysteine deaminase
VTALVLAGGAVQTVDATDRLLPAADVRLEGTAIGPPGTLARPGDTVLDCRTALVMPGLVNVHTHAGTALFRGLVEDAPREFWAGRYAVPGQDRFDVDDHALSARASCAEFLLNGVTCIADRLGSMDRIAPAIEASGTRAVIGHTISDGAGPPDWRTADHVIERFGTDPARSRVFAGLAPHALDSCSDGLLADCAPSGSAAASSSMSRRAGLRSRRCAGAVMTAPSPAWSPPAWSAPTSSPRTASI